VPPQVHSQPSTLTAGGGWSIEDHASSAAAAAVAAAAAIFAVVTPLLALITQAPQQTVLVSTRGPGACAHTDSQGPGQDGVIVARTVDPISLVGSVSGA
jgi:hypothetical protein